MKNMRIRDAAKSAGVPLWRVAEQFGCTDSTFSRKLRRELPGEVQDRIMNIIAELSGGEQNA